MHIHLIVNNHRIPYHCIKLLKMCMQWLFMYLEYYRYIRANEIRKKSFNVRSKSLPYMILCNKTKNEKEETSQYTFLTVSTSSWNTRRCVWWILFFITSTCIKICCRNYCSYCNHRVWGWSEDNSKNSHCAWKQTSRYYHERIRESCRFGAWLLGKVYYLYFIVI